MIPIADSLRRRRVPIVNLFLIFINVLVFLYEISLSDLQLYRLMMSFGAVPAELTRGIDLSPMIPFPVWVTLLTSMFMHGGWLHFGGNMLYLWVFGDNIEDALGSFRYGVFYLLCGLIAGVAQIASSPNSVVPSVGASGAIAGVLGAYLLLFPQVRVRTVVIPGFFIRVVPIPALILIGFWAFMPVLSGVASLGVGTMQTGGIAYWAHIGGFVAGLALVSFFRRGMPPVRLA